MTLLKTFRCWSCNDDDVTTSDSDEHGGLIYSVNNMEIMTTVTDSGLFLHEDYSIVLPHESHAHTCTWMSYGVSTKIWGRQQLVEAVKANLRTIAIAIAQQHEVVRVLVRPDEYQQAMKEFERDVQQQHHNCNRPSSTCGSAASPVLQQNIILIPIPSSINDIWIRDTGPIFVHVTDEAEKRVEVSKATRTGAPILGAISGNFNGWGNKQKHDFDERVAAFIVNYLNNNNTADSSNNSSDASSISIPLAKSSIRPTVQFIENSQMCFEGGGIEVDGNGTAIIIESCVLNKNRNRNWKDKDQCTRVLCGLLGLTKIIWLPGISDPHDITDGHVDGFIRFVPMNDVGNIDGDKHHTATTPPVSTVVMAYNEEEEDHPKNQNSIQSQHMHILQNSTNARNGPIRIVKVPNPSPATLKRVYKKYPDFCASYVNYYICNNHTVLVPQFDISPYDENAIQILKDTFPSTYTICPIPIHTGIACGGGGIHCVTLQQPALR